MINTVIIGISALKEYRTAVVLCEEFLHLMSRILHTPVEVITSAKLELKCDGETNKTKNK